MAGLVEAAGLRSEAAVVEESWEEGVPTAVAPAGAVERREQQGRNRVVHDGKGRRTQRLMRADATTLLGHALVPVAALPPRWRAWPRDRSLPSSLVDRLGQAAVRTLPVPCPMDHLVLTLHSRLERRGDRSAPLAVQ